VVRYTATVTFSSNLLEVIPDRLATTVRRRYYLHVRSLLFLDELLFGNFTLTGICFHVLTVAGVAPRPSKSRLIRTEKKDLSQCPGLKVTSRRNLMQMGESLMIHRRQSTTESPCRRGLALFVLVLAASFGVLAQQPERTLNSRPGSALRFRFPAV
jgi:hypothetical protein